MGREDRWRDPAWLREAHAWIDANLPGPLEGSIEQPHVYPWSTVLRIPTTDGVLWFKANGELERFEASLVPLITEIAPDLLVELVAADADRGWLLMRDAGTCLRELGTEEQLERWGAVLPRYAELQLATALRVEELLGLGVTDVRLGSLTTRFDELLDDRDTLLVGDPDGVSEGELARLRAAIPEVRSMCAELVAAGIPDTIQHDDLNDGQVYERDGRLRILDWADSCVSHPFHTMVVTLRATAAQRRLVPGGSELLRLRDAYLEPVRGARIAGRPPRSLRCRVPDRDAGTSARLGPIVHPFPRRARRHGRLQPEDVPRERSDRELGGLAATPDPRHARLRRSSGASRRMFDLSRYPVIG